MLSSIKKSIYQDELTTPEWTRLTLSGLEVKKPIGVLVFDIDSTLYDPDTHKFINKEKIKKLIQKAIDNNIMLVVATARYYPEIVQKPAEKKIMSIREVIEELDPNAFKFIYFTNNQSKANVLYDLELKLLFLKNNKKLCLVDDQLRFLKPCQRAGFQAIQVDSRGKYLHSIEKFLDEMIQLAQFEQEVLGLKLHNTDLIISIFNTFYQRYKFDMLLYMKSVLTLISNENDRNLFILKISTQYPDFISQALKAEDTEIIGILINNIKKEDIVDIIFSATAHEVRPQVLKWLLETTKNQMLCLHKNRKSLLCKLMDENNIEKAKIVAEFFYGKYSHEELSQMEKTNDITLKRLSLKQKIVSLIMQEQRLANASCVYTKGLFGWPTRQEKINAARYLVHCIENEVPGNHMIQHAAFIWSTKIKKLYLQTYSVLPIAQSKINSNVDIVNNMNEIDRDDFYAKYI